MRRRPRPNPGRVRRPSPEPRRVHERDPRPAGAARSTATRCCRPTTPGYGFDNIADVLTVSPGLLERYLLAAKKISRLAIGDATIRPAVDDLRRSPFRRSVQDERMSEDLPFGSRGGVGRSGTTSRSTASTPWRSAAAQLAEHRQRDPRPRRRERDRRAPRRRAAASVHDRRPRKYRQHTVYRHRGHGRRRLRGRASPRQGRHAHRRRHVPTGHLDVEGVGLSRLPLASDGYASRPHRPSASTAASRWASRRSTSTGPFDGRRREATPSRRAHLRLPPRVRRLTRRRVRAQDPDRRSRAAPTAGPLTRRDVDTLLSFYRTRPQDGELRARHPAGARAHADRPRVPVPRRARSARRDARRRATASATSSSRRGCRSSSGAASPTTSCSTWRRRDQLQEPAVLEQQVRRMLADPRSERAGRQLLRPVALRCATSRGAPPDPKTFPGVRREPARGVPAETELFLESQLREDRTVIELLTPNYTFVNERLARHYGIPNVYGSHFRRVTLPDGRARRPARPGQRADGDVVRRPHVAVAARQVACSRTCSARRRRRRRPNVPPLENDARSQGSLRQRMEQHRKNPVCASCHAQIDPLGFALENFDGIGKWRTSDGRRADRRVGRAARRHEVRRRRRRSARRCSRSSDALRARR